MAAPSRSSSSPRRVYGGFEWEEVKVASVCIPVYKKVVKIEKNGDRLPELFDEVSPHHPNFLKALPSSTSSPSPASSTPSSSLTATTPRRSRGASSMLSSSTTSSSSSRLRSPPSSVHGSPSPFYRSVLTPSPSSSSSSSASSAKTTEAAQLSNILFPQPQAPDVTCFDADSAYHPDRNSIRTVTRLAAVSATPMECDLVRRRTNTSGDSSTSS